MPQVLLRRTRKITQKVLVPLMRVVTIATYYVSLSDPPGKRYQRAVSIQEHKKKVLSITGVDKRVHNDLYPRNFLGKLSLSLLFFWVISSKQSLLLVAVFHVLSHTEVTNESFLGQIENGCTGTKFI